MRDGQDVVAKLHERWVFRATVENRAAYEAACELATMPEPHPPRHPCEDCRGSGHAWVDGYGVELCIICSSSGFLCPSCGNIEEDVLARNWAKGCCDNGWHCGFGYSLWTYAPENKDPRYTGPWNGCLFCDVWRELRILAFGQQWITNTLPGDDSHDIE